MYVVYIAGEPQPFKAFARFPDAKAFADAKVSGQADKATVFQVTVPDGDARKAVDAVQMDHGEVVYVRGSPPTAEEMRKAWDEHVLQRLREEGLL